MDAGNLNDCLEIWTLQKRATEDIRDLIFSYDYANAYEEDRHQ